MNRSAMKLAALVVAVLTATGGLVALTMPTSRPLPARPDGWSVAGDTPLAYVPPKPFPPKGKAFLGLQTNLGPYDFAAVDTFTAVTAHQPSVLQFSQGWAEDQFDTSRFNAIAERGMMPIVSWEPWNFREDTGTGYQPAYRLSAIAGGVYDDYVRSWATGIAALPYPVVIRFAHEMNGFWYPWCEQSNGNQPGDYVRAWRHVHDIFTAAGADNVTWLWSPNVSFAGADPLSRYYPGDSYVDWIGLSGYYGTGGRQQYISFDEIFASTLAELTALAHKPIIIAETGATDAIGQRARWVEEMFRQLSQHPEVIGMIWFEATKELDWRLASSPAAAAAYAAAANDPRYDVAWTPSGRPRGT